MYSNSITKGQFLIANPSVNDLDFNQSIIIICEHNHSGSIGFIINHPTNNVVNDFIPSLQCEFPVYNGGPVERDNLYFIHSRPDLISNSTQVGDDLYWLGEYEDLKKALEYKQISENEIRFYLGYAGWIKNQLEQEITEKNWTLTSAKINILKNLSGNIWKEQMKKIREESLLWINSPSNPNLN